MKRLAVFFKEGTRGPGTGLRPPGFRTVVGMIQEVLLFVPELSEREAPLPHLLKPFYKYFRGGHSEHETMIQAFEKTNRIQVVVSRGIAVRSLKVEFRFYAKGQREPIYTLETNIGILGGQVLGGVISSYR